MSGNVYEWCEDWYHNSYQNAPTNGRAWLSPSGSYRVLRGGSWDLSVFFARIETRISLDPDLRDDDSGLRLARTP